MQRIIQRKTPKGTKMLRSSDFARLPSFYKQNLIYISNMCDSQKALETEKLDKWAIFTMNSMNDIFNDSRTFYQGNADLIKDDYKTTTNRNAAYDFYRENREFMKYYGKHFTNFSKNW
jgi:hypothetical protein